jgi:Uma2 family endonuclease
VDVGIDEHNVYQPDVVVLQDLPPDDVSDVGIPLLVVEVLSPATGKRDREVKTRHYLEAGVEEVWLVDPREATVEVRTRGGARTARDAEVATSAAVPGFALVPDRLFAPPEGPRA